ncbi:MAG TPA: methyltransferase domain-containing protein [Gemmatimonadales bacterium]
MPGSDPAGVERLLRTGKFSGYQRITLPDGRVIPGADRLPAADLIYGADLAGKSVLDVGCYYGFFLHEAIRRGAARAVGIEADPERYRIASTLAPLWDGKVEIHEGLLEEVPLDEKFDVVLFLNVLHHVRDPLAVVRRLAALCRGTLVIEFRQPHDPQFVRECFHPHTSVGPRRSLPARLWYGALAAVEARVAEWVAGRMPLVGVGAVEYHRTWFFSRAAFRNAFQVHNGLFERVEFRDSLSRGQALAFCRCQRD